MKTFRLLLFSILLLPGLVQITAAQQRDAPRYEKVPARVFQGKVAKLDQRSHKLARHYRTSLSEQLVEAGVNFAGHYSVAVVGCGTGCSVTAIIDARNGKAFFPRAFDGWTSIVGDYEIPDGEDVRTFRRNSRLLKVIGRPRLGVEERWGPSGIYYYEWAGNKLRLVKFIPVGSYPDPDPPTEKPVAKSARHRDSS